MTTTLKPTQRYRICRCNGLLMLPQRILPNVLSHWCPHMEPDGRVDTDRHLAWQKLNRIPDWLCKVKRVPAFRP